MGALSHLLVASAAEAEAAADVFDPSQRWESFLCRGLSNIHLAAIWALAESGSPEDRFEERLEAIKTISHSDQGPWVDVAPPELTAALAKLAALEAPDVAPLGTRLGACEDFVGWEEDDLVSLLRSAGDLAESAQLVGKTLLLHTTL